MHSSGSIFSRDPRTALCLGSLALLLRR